MALIGLISTDKNSSMNMVLGHCNFLALNLIFISADQLDQFHQW